MDGIALKAFSKSRGMSSNDSGKLQRIMSLAGLNVRDGKDTLTTQLVKKKPSAATTIVEGKAYGAEGN